MSDSEKVMRRPPTIEDIEFAIVHSLALLSASADDLTCAGYAITNPHAYRRARLTGVRAAIIAARELEHRLIDVPTLARQMVPQARKYLVDRPGVYEVHFCDGDVSEVRVTYLWRFVREWELEPELLSAAGIHDRQFIGIVGDGCAVLYPLAAIEQEATA